MDIQGFGVRRRHLTIRNVLVIIALGLPGILETYPAAMQSNSLTRVSKVSIATSILLLFLAMMLPVCHLHPLLDKTAPDHCAICVSLHATPPLGVHVPPVVHLFQTGKVLVSFVTTLPSLVPRFASSRAPPLPAC